MIQKKSPRCLAAVGANQKGGKVRDLAYPHHATPPRPAQAESCDRCQFFRRVALPSGPPSSALWDAAPITCRTGAAGLSSAPASR